MRYALAALIFLAALAAAGYVGIFVMLVGGIVEISDGLEADPNDAKGIAWGVVRILFASAASGLVVWLGVLAAYVAVGREARRRW